MNIAETLALLAAIASLVTAVTVIIGFINLRTSRVRLTSDLYNQFFDLIESRSQAWSYLEQIASTQSFEQLWRVADQRDFMSLYRVVAFWFLFYRLYNANEIDKPLARSLFAYEFYYWQKQVFPMVERTKEIDAVFPDVLDPFLSTSWLIPDEQIPTAKRLTRLG